MASIVELSNGPLSIILKSLTILDLAKLSRVNKRMNNLVIKRGYPILFNMPQLLDENSKFNDFKYAIQDKFLCFCCGYIAEIPMICNKKYWGTRGSINGCVCCPEPRENKTLQRAYCVFCAKKCHDFFRRTDGKAAQRRHHFFEHGTTIATSAQMQQHYEKTFPES